MEEVIFEAIKTQNPLLMREVLLSIEIFAQISQCLQHDQNQHFFSSCQLLRIGDHHIFQIQVGKLYFFINKGVFVEGKGIREQKGQNSRTMNKVRKNSQIKNSHILNSEKVEVEASAVVNFENWFCENEQILKFYISHHGVSLLVFPFNSLPQKLGKKIKSYYIEKLKFISKFDIFSNISKNILHANLFNFKFIKVLFNEYLYSTTKKNDQVFFIKKGEIQIQEENRKKIIIRAPKMLGDAKMNENESAKCLTDSCLAYTMKKSILEELTKESMQEITSKSTEGKLRVEFMKAQKREQICNCNNKSFFETPPARKCHGSSQNLSKKFMLRKYFTNYINEKYDEFYQKKTSLLRDKASQNEHPLLYKMKKKHPKAPDYEEMKKKLKMARIKKILAYKENTERRNAHSILKYCEKPNNICYDHNKYNCLKEKVMTRTKFVKIFSTNDQH